MFCICICLILIFRLICYVQQNSCQFAELYQGKMRDLFGNLVECFVREDDAGIIHIRGPTIHNKESGDVKVQPLTPIYIPNGVSK